MNQKNQRLLDVEIHRKTYIKTKVKNNEKLSVKIFAPVIRNVTADITKRTRLATAMCGKVNISRYYK